MVTPGHGPRRPPRPGPRRPRRCVAGRTLARWPFSVDGDRATGPGAFDMEGARSGPGVVRSRRGSVRPNSRPARCCGAGHGGRGGSGHASGREMHRGHHMRRLQRACSTVGTGRAEGGAQGGRATTPRPARRRPVRARRPGAGEMGVNALVAAAGLVLAVEAFAPPTSSGQRSHPRRRPQGRRGTRCRVPLLSRSTSAATIAERDRVDDGIPAIRCDNGATLTIEGGVNRPPLEETRAAPRAGAPRRRAVRTRRHRRPRSEWRSDGDLTAMGVPTLNGLGAIGAGRTPRANTSRCEGVPERAALLAALIIWKSEEELH